MFGGMYIAPVLICFWFTTRANLSFSRWLLPLLEGSSLTANSRQLMGKLAVSVEEGDGQCSAPSASSHPPLHFQIEPYTVCLLALLYNYKSSVIGALVPRATIYKQHLLKVESFPRRWG